MSVVNGVKWGIYFTIMSCQELTTQYLIGVQVCNVQTISHYHYEILRNVMSEPFMQVWYMNGQVVNFVYC